MGYTLRMLWYRLIFAMFALKVTLHSPMGKAKELLVARGTSVGDLKSRHLSSHSYVIILQDGEIVPDYYVINQDEDWSLIVDPEPTFRYLRFAPLFRRELPVEPIISLARCDTFQDLANEFKRYYADNFPPTRITEVAFAHVDDARISGHRFFEKEDPISNHVQKQKLAFVYFHDGMIDAFRLTEI